MEKHRPRSEEKEWTRRLQEWEQGTDAQDWDSPGDDLWDRIAGDLPEAPPPERRAAWIWWSIAGFLLLISVIGYRIALNIAKDPVSLIGEDRITKDIGIEERALRLPQEKNNESGLTVPKQAAVDVQAYFSSENSPKSGTGIPSAVKGAPLQEEKTEEVNPGGEEKELKALPANDAQVLRQKSDAVSPIAIPAEGKTGPRTWVTDPLLITEKEPFVKPIPPVSARVNKARTALVRQADQQDAVSRLPSLLEALPTSPTLNLGTPRPMAYPSFNWYLGLQASIPPARQQTRGPHRIRQQSFEPRLELWLGRVLGQRWQVEVGYAQEKNQRLRQTSFIRRFDPQNEQVQNDQNVTTYKLNILDNSGSAKEEVDVTLVRRPGQSVLPGDRVLIQTDIQDQFRVRAIPVRVGYDLLRYRSFQLQTLVGVEWQRQYRSLELERVMVLHPRFDSLTLPDRQRQREQQRDVWRFTTSFRTSVQLNPRLGLYLQPQWSWGGTNAKTQDFHFSGGAFWRF